MLRRVADLARVAFRGMGESSSLPEEIKMNSIRKYSRNSVFCIFYTRKSLQNDNRKSCSIDMTLSFHKTMMKQIKP